MSNLATVQAIYEAFSKGDVPAIIERVSDDVKWEHWENNFAQKYGVVYLRARHGKAGVAEFFASLAAIELQSLDVLNLMEGGNQVAVSFTIAFVVKATGKRLRDEEVHLWTFDPQGRVIALRHYVDTAKHVEANSGAA